MSSQAVSGKGTQFRKWDSSVPEWTSISEIISISGPGKSRETIDVTSLDSTGGYREFIGSFRDGGTVSLTMIFRRDTYDIMDDDFESDVVQSYEIVLPDADNTTIEFDGFVTEVPLEISADDAIKANVTIKVTSKPVINSGSGPSAGV